MTFETATTASDLIDILEACARNTHTPLDELVVCVGDDSGFAHYIKDYETLETDKGWLVILNEAK